MKKLFIKRHVIKQKAAVGIKKYPEAIRYVGIFYTDAYLPDANFITKLKTCFGHKAQISKFGLCKNNKQDAVIFLNNKAFNFYGKLKDETISEHLSNLDIVIDMSLKPSVLKDYALSLAKNSYKIVLGHFPEKVYHLSINLRENQKDLFIDEIIKYHKILSYDKK